MKPISCRETKDSTATIRTGLALPDKARFIDLIAGYKQLASTSPSLELEAVRDNHVQKIDTTFDVFARAMRAL